MSSRLYLGVLEPRGHTLGKFELFWSSTVPTEETHGHLYPAVIGPFRTKRGAEYMASHYWCNTVHDAERLSKKEVKDE